MRYFVKAQLKKRIGINFTIENSRFVCPPYGKTLLSTRCFIAVFIADKRNTVASKHLQFYKYLIFK